MKVVAVEVDVERLVHLGEAVQRPLAGALPCLDHFRIAPVPARVERPHFGFQVGVLIQAAGGFGIQVAHPAGDIGGRILPGMELHVVPQPTDDVQADIAEVIGAHHLITGKRQDARSTSPKMALRR